MWKQRYRNEALYPYNGPVAVKTRLSPQRRRLTDRRYRYLKLKIA
jgi:hypothetical protein